MEKIIEHFRKNDPRLYGYFLKYPQVAPVTKDKPVNYFSRLCRMIIGQQLSGKVADVIISRFVKLFNGKKVTPQNVLVLAHDDLRRTGISNAKARYVRNLAQYFQTNKLLVKEMDRLENGDLISELTKVKGVGPWTVEMFLIFVLGREDVFSFGDYGLKKAIRNIYGFKNEPEKKEITALISCWSPYKSYACRVLWLSLV